MDPSDYSIIALYFPRLLGIIYVIAFGAFLFQIRGLLGTNGILPIKTLIGYCEKNLGKKRFYRLPSLFWLNSSDAALMIVAGVGTLCGFLLIFNVLPAWTPFLILLAYLLQLSIISVGQDFLGFGWEIYLCDLSFTSIFLTLSSPPNPFIWFSLNLMLFRCYFQGGVSKLISRDINWRNLTAVAYHYQTQPLPNTTAWFVHKLPLWFHKFSTLMMFFSELVAPLAIFGTQEMRLVAFVFIAGLQVFIWLTGNFSYLNHMTFLFAFILLNNDTLSFLQVPQASHSLFFDITLSLVGCALIIIQLLSFWSYFFPYRTIGLKILQWIAPLQIVSRFGIFAVMTTKRYEVIIEGSVDGQIWKEYTFYFKPSEVTRRPKRVSPYQPRLDWMMWFLPFRPYSHSPWFQNFLKKLLEGSPAVLKLIKTNPFPEHPPKYIRALLYDYTFSDWKTLKTTGAWWNRRFHAPFSPVIMLNLENTESTVD